MEYGLIENKVVELAQYIDGRIDNVEIASNKTQALIYAMIREEILKFEIANGSYVIGQDLRPRIAIIQNKIEAILNTKVYTIPIRDFLTDFTKIQDKTIDLFKSVNDLEIEISELTPAKQIIYDQAKNYLTKSVAEAYIEPVKKLVAQNVMQGRSITDTVRILEKWNDGDLSSGRLANGTPTPDLKRYATQVARDTAYSVQRTTNNIFKQRYGLTKFVYSGNLVKDSRPFCKHLVHLNRIIDINEVPPLVALYPEGLMPNTTRETFPLQAGGFSCRHLVMMVG